MHSASDFRYRVAFLRVVDSTAFLLILSVVLFALVIVIGYYFSLEYVGSLFVVAFVVLGFLKPELFLVLVFAGRPVLDQFVEHTFFHIGSRNVNIQAVIVVSLVSVSMFYFLTRKSNLLKYGASFGALLFLFESLISNVFSSDLVFGISNWLRLVSWIFLIFLVAEVFKTAKRISMLITASIIAAVISAAIVLGNIGGSVGAVVGYGVGERYGGFLGGHSAALTLVSLFPFVVIRIFQTERYKRVFYTVIAFAVITAVFATFVRSAWIGLLIQIVLLSFMRKWRGMRFVNLMIIVAVVVLVVLEFRTVQQRWSDLEYLWTPGMARSAGSGRLWIWSEFISTYLRASLGRKLFGFGLGTLGIIGVPLGAHNDFIEICVGSGLFGFLAYVMFLVQLLKFIIKLNHAAPSKETTPIAQALVIAFASYLTIALVNGNIYNLNSMWYFGGMLGIGYSILRQRAEPHDVKQEGSKEQSLVVH